MSPRNSSNAIPRNAYYQRTPIRVLLLRANDLGFGARSGPKKNSPNKGGLAGAEGWGHVEATGRARIQRSLVVDDATRAEYDRFGGAGISMAKIRIPSKVITT